MSDAGSPLWQELALLVGTRVEVRSGGGHRGVLLGSRPLPEGDLAWVTVSCTFGGTFAMTVGRGDVSPQGDDDV